MSARCALIAKGAKPTRLGMTRRTRKCCDGEGEDARTSCQDDNVNQERAGPSSRMRGEREIGGLDVWRCDACWRGPRNNLP